MNFGKSDLPKFVLGDPNSAILGAPPLQDTQQVSGRSGGKKPLHLRVSIVCLSLQPPSMFILVWVWTASLEETI